MKTLKIVIIAAVCLVIVIGGFLLKTFRDAGEFKEINPSFDGTCEAVPGVLSSEDITIHPKTGLAFISSDDRRPLFKGKEGEQGAVFGYDLKADEPKLVNLTQDFEKEFHPHGIGLYIGKGGSTSLFVVNHSKAGHFVEIFDYEKHKLHHRKSIKGELMHSPNDVLPVGPEKFYVSNDHGSVSKFGKTAEDYLQLSKSHILFYNGSIFRKVTEGLKYANGIAIDSKGKTVYVATSVGRKVMVYNRNVKTGNLDLRHEIDLGTGADNIEMDAKGNLWIGAHPKLLTFVKYAKNPDLHSPSEVLKVSVRKDGSFKVDQIYLDTGEEISGSSVAAVFKNTMLIGSVFDKRFLVCRLPSG